MRIKSINTPCTIVGSRFNQGKGNKQPVGPEVPINKDSLHGLILPLSHKSGPLRNYLFTMMSTFETDGRVGFLHVFLTGHRSSIPNFVPKLFRKNVTFFVPFGKISGFFGGPAAPLGRPRAPKTSSSCCGAPEAHTIPAVPPETPRRTQGACLAHELRGNPMASANGPSTEMESRPAPWELVCGKNCELSEEGRNAFAL